MKDKISIIIKLALAFISLLSINYVCDLNSNKYYVNSVMILILLVAICYFFIKYLDFKAVKSKSTKLFLIIISICFATLNVFGYNLYTTYTLQLIKISTYFYIFGLSLLYFSIFSIVTVKFKKIIKYLNKINIPLIDKFIFSKKTFIKCTLLLLLAWLPILLAFYPGIFSYDAPAEYLEYYNGVYKGGHPYAHANMVGYLVRLGHTLFNSYNVGVLIYTIVQMILVSFTMSYIISFLNKRKVPFIYKFMVLLLFMFLPTHSMLAITATRDILFSCAMVLFFIKFYEFYFEKNSIDKLNIKYALNIFLLIILAFCIFISRTNGIYGYIFMLVFVVIPLRKYWRSFLAMNIILFSIFALYNSWIHKYMMKQTVEENFPIQYIIPFQQLARVYPKATKSEQKQLDFYMREVDGKSGWYNYLPRRADGVFVPANNANLINNSSDFWKLYIKLAKKYGLTYIDAMFDSTIGYWYVADSLPDNMRPYIEIKCYEPFNITNNQIKFESKLPKLYDAYYDLTYNGEFQKIPILSLIMSTAFNNILFVSLMILLICKKKIRYVTPYMLFVGIMGTYLVGPTCILRYMYFIYLGIPIFIYFVYNTINCSSGEKNEK